jgi:hypothetical protein
MTRVAEQTSPLTPTFTYSATSNRYRDTSTGRYVPQAAVRAALDTVIEASTEQVRAASLRLQAGQLAVADWQRQMAAEMKVQHLAAAASARGGWAQLSQADLGWTGQRLRSQYQYLQGFAQQVADGTQPLDGRFLRRAEMYAEASRGTAREMERRIARQSGATEERRNLGAADHCGTCLDQAARGWQPVGTLNAIGNSECRTKCRCWFSSRTVAATETQAA